MADRGYQVVIGAKFDGTNYTYLHLDTCTDKQITASATIPTQPLQDGRTMSDHMYRNPDTYNIRGSFGLFGQNRNNTDYDNIPDVGTAGDRLTNIQSVFEYIKDNGILCDLTTLDEGANGTVRFKIRKSMALKSITWVESQVSMTYSFEWQEVICVNAQQYIEAKMDDDLPSIYLPEARSLGQVMVQENLADGEVSPYVKIVLQSLIQNGYIQNGVVRFLAAAGTNAVAIMVGMLQVSLVAVIGAIVATAVVIGAVIGLSAILTAVGASAAAMTAIFPVGTIVGAAIGAIVGVIALVAHLINKNKEKAKQKKMFKLVQNLDHYIDKNGYLDDAKLAQALKDGSVKASVEELDRLQKFLSDIKNQILNITDNCAFYSLSSGPDDNNEREVVLNIGNTPYYITFYKTPGQGYGWNASVKTPGASGDVELDGTNGEMLNRFCPVSTFEEMDVYTNCMFRDATRQYEVYLYNPSLNPEVNRSTTAMRNAATYLSSYQLVVSRGHIKDNVNKIYEAINNAIIEGGYV